MSRVAVIGARGFVGNALAAELARTGHEVTCVTRDSYDAARTSSYDAVINAAMPSGRFWAKNNPERDFVETVKKTADLVYAWKYERFVQISSISARCQLDTIYGRHKAAAEKLCDANALIVRLGPMFAPTLAKGVLIDMLHDRPVYLAGESRYAFTDLAFVAHWVALHWNETGIVEVGARNSLALREVADHLGSLSTFDGAIDHQEMTSPSSDFPDARGVLSFLDAQRAILGTAPSS